MPTEREAIGRRRDVAAAEAQRDAVRAEAAAKGRAADAALKEVEQATQRLRVERQAVERWVSEEIARLGHTIHSLQSTIAPARLARARASS